MQVRNWACFLCVSDEGYDHFSHIVAKDPSVFSKIKGPISDEANRGYGIKIPVLCET